MSDRVQSTPPAGAPAPAATSARRVRPHLLENACRGMAPSRRAFLSAATVQGMTLSTAYLLASGPGMVRSARAATSPSSTRKKGALRLDESVPSDGSPAGRLVRDFNDPYLELLRLLHEASEVEHALMLQYLGAAFSLKPEYQDIAGYGDPNAHDLIGVAIQEMQHLSAVNRLLVELGAAPHLARQDFPYEPDIYPFEFNLEPLSRRSVAKYTYTEAPAGATDPRLAASPEDAAFVAALLDELGPDIRPNHVGSLYDTVIGTLDELASTSPAMAERLAPWRDRLIAIQGEGEIDHFHFFKSLFMATHDGFGGRADVWSLAPGDPAYPSFPLAWNPSAYVGHANQIQDPTALALGWLGDLHYWTALLLLDHAYRENDEQCVELARLQMLGPIYSLARHMPRYGLSLPFDPLSMGYAPGLDRTGVMRMVLHMLNEATELANRIEDQLPPDYPLDFGSDAVAVLEERYRDLAPNLGSLASAQTNVAVPAAP